MRICIIGGGASGLVAAISAKSNNNEVFILERNNKCGKKLLLTGNGRCNFWNENQDLSFYHSHNLEILENIFKLEKDKVLPFFKRIGIISKVKDGYYYPFSNQATAILNALLTEINKLNIKIYCDELVTNIKKEKNFIITTNHKTYFADKVILATGSKAYPKTGSDGNGYNIAKSLGHTLIPVLPALTSLIGCDKFYKNWEGIRTECEVSLYENNQFIKKEKGEIQLTNYGVSGICIFNLSSQVALGLQEKKKEEIKINFVPWCRENIRDWLDKQEKLLKDYNLQEMLEGFLNYKLINLIFKLEKLPKDIKWQNIKKEKIANYLTNFTIEIKDTKSFDNAQVCQGGIPLDEVDANTLESKIVKDLYFTGEILDVDGCCGGYNLGFAWMSGMLAGESGKKNA